MGNFAGVLAQLVERLNGIEEVRGSNPLGSSGFVPADFPVTSWGDAVVFREFVAAEEPFLKP